MISPKLGSLSMTGHGHPPMPIENHWQEKSCGRLHRLLDKPDLFMSLIHTCELNGVNSFDYLVALQRNAAAVALAPADWMPWNYRRQ